MKLEKREITLNEYDSLNDMLQTEKNLLLSYTQALEFLNRKETQETVIKLIRATAERVCYLRSLMGGSSIENC